MDRAVLIDEIRQLKQELDAVILAHNYELGEIQDIADFCGDSLELSIKAAAIEARTIVFCGVRFMAETAKILSPDKLVLLPVPDAGCDMADMIDAASLRAWKAEHPGALAVCYVNSTAEVKAECDLCVTSANAPELVEMLPADREILFLPDGNLGSFCARNGRLLRRWDGCCPVHQRMTTAMVERRRREFPGAKLLIHPEAPPEVTALADEALSTGGMLRYVRESQDATFIIGTEIGILHRMQQENPDKRLIPLTEQAICPHMKRIRLEELLYAMQNRRTVIEIPEAIRERAEIPIRRMLERDFSWL
ncbi:MAG: quinolinate synthase NadA [Lentisphaeria bacterium]|nr:quinolinate synthase NadA [Lentisphaeria bacterium]